MTIKQLYALKLPIIWNHENRILLNDYDRTTGEYTPSLQSDYLRVGYGVHTFELKLEEHFNYDFRDLLNLRITLKIDALTKYLVDVGKRTKMSVPNYFYIDSDLIPACERTYWFASGVSNVASSKAWTFELMLDVVATFGAGYFQELVGKRIKFERRHDDRVVKQGEQIVFNPKYLGLLNSDFDTANTQGSTVTYVNAVPTVESLATSGVVVTAPKSYPIYAQVPRYFMYQSYTPNDPNLDRTTLDNVVIDNRSDSTGKRSSYYKYGVGQFNGSPSAVTIIARNPSDNKYYPLTMTTGGLEDTSYYGRRFPPFIPDILHRIIGTGNDNNKFLVPIGQDVYTDSRETGYRFMPLSYANTQQTINNLFPQSKMVSTFYSPIKLKSTKPPDSLSAQSDRAFEWFIGSGDQFFAILRPITSDNTARLPILRRSAWLWGSDDDALYNAIGFTPRQYQIREFLDEGAFIMPHDITEEDIPLPQIGAYLAKPNSAEAKLAIEERLRIHREPAIYHQKIIQTEFIYAPEANSRLLIDVYNLVNNPVAKVSVRTDDVGALVYFNFADRQFLSFNASTNLNIYTEEGSNYLNNSRNQREVQKEQVEMAKQQAIFGGSVNVAGGIGAMGIGTFMGGPKGLAMGGGGMFSAVRGIGQIAFGIKNAELQKRQISSVLADASNKAPDPRGGSGNASAYAPNYEFKEPFTYKFTRPNEPFLDMIVEYHHRYGIKDGFYRRLGDKWWHTREHFDFFAIDDVLNQYFDPSRMNVPELFNELMLTELERGIRLWHYNIGELVFDYDTLNRERILWDGV